MVLKIGSKGSIFFRAGKIIRAQKIASVKNSVQNHTRWFTSTTTPLIESAPCGRDDFVFSLLR